MATATQARGLSVPLTPPSASSGSFITQVTRLLFQPAAFFRALPGGSQWLLAALLVLAITGYTATTQVQSSTSTSSSTTTSSTSFDLSLLDESASQSQNQSQNQSAPTAPQTSTNTTSAASTTITSDTTLMTALIAASGMLVMWLGQTILLTLVPMMRGYPPRVGRSFQIAVWASLPLALMLVLRAIHYSTGGTGGALGLSLLLDDWSGYTTLTTYGQRVAAVFMSNLTLFWLWDLVLLYLGARYALNGRPITVFVIVALWIVAATTIPALVSEPETRTAPRQTTSVTTTTTNDTSSSTTTTQTQQMFPGGGDFSSGGFPSGGSFPGGNSGSSGGAGGAGGGPPGG